MIWKSLRAEPVRTKKERRAAFLCCLFRHAEASACCYIKLYNKWAWALWTGWPHKPGRVTRSLTCGSNKKAPPSARHVGDTAFQRSSLKLKNKSDREISRTGQGIWRLPLLLDFLFSIFEYVLYIFQNLNMSIVTPERHKSPPPKKILITLNSICSSSPQL